METVTEFVLDTGDSLKYESPVFKDKKPFI